MSKKGVKGTRRKKVHTMDYLPEEFIMNYVTRTNDLQVLRKKTPGEELTLHFVNKYLGIDYSNLEKENNLQLEKRTKYNGECNCGECDKCKVVTVKDLLTFLMGLRWVSYGILYTN